jgi:hypothetical protein
MGEYLHSKDTRRIINALFKYFKYLHRDTGALKESDVQMGQEGLRLRYYPILIWMRAKHEVLEASVAKRIV